ncbi:hypothetical protein, partial [Bifidobacterium pseudocatenulatum]|uniref:hypothetical protein n=1 Tax=Bifidobacterium pseudocatenulatum TaxID=28026 RepID=UPI0034A3BA85
DTVQIERSGCSGTSADSEHLYSITHSTFGGFIILIAILRSVTNQLGITPTHLFELGEAFCAPSEQKFFNFF